VFSANGQIGGKRSAGERERAVAHDQFTRPRQQLRGKRRITRGSLSHPRRRQKHDPA